MVSNILSSCMLSSASTRSLSAGIGILHDQSRNQRSKLVKTSGLSTTFTVSGKPSRREGLSTMLDKPIEDISLADVQAFFDDGGKYPERKTIEYKQELHKFKDDRGRVEFAKDVCSLANTSGGHILFGFSEEDGYPTGLPGAHCEDPDEAIRDMRTAIRIATDPRIDVHAVDIQPVASRSQGKYFFIVRIAQSLNAPHAVLRADRDSVREFWNRH